MTRLRLWFWDLIGWRSREPEPPVGISREEACRKAALEAAKRHENASRDVTTQLEEAITLMGRQEDER